MILRRLEKLGFGKEGLMFTRDLLCLEKMMMMGLNMITTATVVVIWRHGEEFLKDMVRRR